MGAARSTAPSRRWSRRRTPSSASRRYQQQLHDLISSDEITDLPEGAQERGAALHRGRAGGLLDLPLARARPRLGIPVPDDPEPGDVRLGRRAGELHHGPRLRQRRRRLPALLARRARPRPGDRQGHPALPRGLLAGDAALGGAAGADPCRRPWLSDDRRPEDEQVARQRRRSDRGGRAVRRRPAALLPAARHLALQRRRLLGREAAEPLPGRPGQRPGQPAQPEPSA